MRKKITTGTEVQQTIRIPKEIYDWVADVAAQDRRSINSQIVLLLEEIKSIKAQNQPADDDPA